MYIHKHSKAVPMVGYAGWLPHSQYGGRIGWGEAVSRLGGVGYLPSPWEASQERPNRLHTPTP